jgi:polysaccharide pyruvyl transferase CsaB
VAGNEGYQGLFTPNKLEQARLGNFCCRGLPMSTPEQLLADLTDVLGRSDKEKQGLGAYGRKVIFDYYSVRRMAQDCLDMYAQVRRRKYKVVMSGYYGFSNAGDDAILQSIQQSIQQASDEVDITVLSNDPELTKASYGLEALPRFRVWTVLRALWRCDALISGGGSLLQDRTSTRSLLYYLSIIRAAQLMGKPVMLYANGIGPVQKPGNRKRVRQAVERATLVTLRDHSSAQELRDMGVTRQDLYVTADPVFHLEPASSWRGSQLLKSAGLDADAPFVAVSVRDWPDTEDFLAGVAQLCDHLRRTYGLEVLFVLMQPQRDRQAAQTVRQAMEERSCLLDVPCSPKELMGVLGRGKLCLAMRLHTLIFAARMAVPMLGLVYDPKVASYLQELGMPSAGDVTSFDPQAAIDQADRLMARYASCKRELREQSEALSQAARQNEKLLLEMLEQRRK